MEDFLLVVPYYVTQDMLHTYRQDSFAAQYSIFFILFYVVYSEKSSLFEKIIWLKYFFLNESDE